MGTQVTYHIYDIKIVNVKMREKVIYRKMYITGILNRKIHIHTIGKLKGVIFVKAVYVYRNKVFPLNASKHFVLIL